MSCQVDTFSQCWVKSFKESMFMNILSSWKIFPMLSDILHGKKCLVKAIYFHNVERYPSWKVCSSISCQVETCSQCWAERVIHRKYVYECLVKLRHFHNVEWNHSKKFTNVLTRQDIFTMLSNTSPTNLWMSCKAKIPTHDVTL